MAGLESLTGISKAAEVSLQIAGERGRIAAHQILKLLKDVTGEGKIISYDQAQAIAAAKQREAEETYLAERIKGKHNSLCSTGSGLVAIVTGRAKQKAERLLGSDPVFFEQVGANGEQAIYRMRMDSGWFMALGEGAHITGVTFYEKADGHVGERIFGGGDRFKASVTEVVKIETDAGDFWQNPNFFYDESQVS